MTRITNFQLVALKNTWTRAIKDVGLVCGESLERNRRNPANKFTNAQIDETAFYKRKWEKAEESRRPMRLDHSRSR